MSPSHRHLKITSRIKSASKSTSSTSGAPAPSDTHTQTHTQRQLSQHLTLHNQNIVLNHKERTNIASHPHQRANKPPCNDYSGVPTHLSRIRYRSEIFAGCAQTRRKRSERIPQRRSKTCRIGRQPDVMAVQHLAKGAEAITAHIFARECIYHCNPALTTDLHTDGLPHQNSST